MNIKQVRRRHSPRYPSRSATRSLPDLGQSIPRRWRKNRTVLGALAGVLGIGAAGVSAVLSAPGCASGSYGCVAVQPPVFLSEAEARAVIIDEAKKAGIDFKQGGPAIKGVTMDVYQKDKVVSKEKVKADGYDAARHIAFVFVSKQDTERWTSGNRASMRADSEIAAEDIKDQVEKAKAGRKVGEFYEPFMFGSKSNPAAAKLRDEKELRRQVQDFVRWLKSQGVI